jgi:arginase family enzyme
MPESFDSSSCATIHLNLDDAWPVGELGLRSVDAREWGPKLRFCAPARLIEEFFAEIETKLAPFVVYGSGDFHHLSALWIRRVREPVAVVSFDNHPDWDVRPPWWSCGAWVNRALELPQVQSAHVWGCGNFECWWPTQFFGNRRAEREGKLAVHPWADDRAEKDHSRRGVIFRATWREEFGRFVRGIAGAATYITVDIDCLRPEDAATNWENGKFSAEDVSWAIALLREQTRVVGGDLCGAFSEQKYARAGQRFVAKIDHPKSPPWDVAEAQTANRATLDKLWPVLANTPLKARPNS